MRICLVYDCLYPYTVGGAERWYRALAERLAEAGHDVTYLTLRQWPGGAEADVPGVRVVAVGPRLELYVHGRRRILPPLVFGGGVLAHLARHGRRYDVVHTASFPYFSLLAAAAVRPVHRFGLFVDWFELWTREYWRDYLGGARGAIGAGVQQLCVRTKHRAFCFSRLHEQRLRELGFAGEVVRLRGLYDGPPPPDDPAAAEPVVVYAGRHIPEKEVAAVLPAVALAREAAPELRCVVFGDGPERETVLRQRQRLALDDAADVPGVAPAERVAAAMRNALCLLAPSRREGYGLVVVEAAAVGTPSVVAAGADNAAAELVETGENGVVAPSADPRALADAILRIRDAGPALRDSTLAWFRSHRDELSLAASLERVLAAYGGD